MIKQASLENLEEIVVLFDLYRIFYKKDSDLGAARKFLTERIVNKESVILVAYAGGEAVGFTQLYPTYSSARMVRNWILNDLYVKADFRGRSYGENLIKEALHFAKSKGATFVQLETQIGNSIAQNLYKKIGFVQQEPDGEFLVFKNVLA